MASKENKHKYADEEEEAAEGVHDDVKEMTGEQ
jgi:hypothetical protein